MRDTEIQIPSTHSTRAVSGVLRRRYIYTRQVATAGQGCDSRTRGNHARGLKNSLHAVFTRYLRGNHVRYIYGKILKYTVNTGDSVFFLVVGGRRVFKFHVWCACLSLLFSLSLFAPFPPALCVRLQLQYSSPWTMVVRIQTSAKCY